MPSEMVNVCAEAALPAEAAADSVPKVAPPPAPAGAVLSPAHKAGFDLEKEYLLAELESGAATAVLRQPGSERVPFIVAEHDGVGCSAGDD